MAKKNSIKDIVRQILDSYLPDTDLELYNVEYQKEGSDRYLRVYIDKKDHEAYVDTADCEKVSQFLSERLDMEDPIEQNYYLEVSSPGLDRRLFEPKDFERYKDHMVDVKLYRSLDGSRKWQGKLCGLVDGEVVIEDEDGEIRRFKEDIVARVNLAVIF